MLLLPNEKFKVFYKINTMTQLTLNIADNQINFFLELIKKFDFVKVENESENIELSEKEKSTLDRRLENHKNNPNSYLDIEEVRNNLKEKYEL